MFDILIAAAPVHVEVVSPVTGKLEQWEVRCIVVGLHNDFAMRVHTGMLTGMAGRHPGGWCICVRNGTVYINGRPVVIGGYTQAIEQPALDGSPHLKACDEQLLLDSAGMQRTGERAELIRIAAESGGVLQRLDMHSAGT